MARMVDLSAYYVINESGPVVWCLNYIYYDILT